MGSLDVFEVMFCEVFSNQYKTCSRNHSEHYQFGISGQSFLWGDELMASPNKVSYKAVCYQFKNIHANAILQNFILIMCALDDCLPQSLLLFPLKTAGSVPSPSMGWTDVFFSSKTFCKQKLCFKCFFSLQVAFSAIPMHTLILNKLTKKIIIITNLIWINTINRLQYKWPHISMLITIKCKSDNGQTVLKIVFLLTVIIKIKVIQQRLNVL